MPSELAAEHVYARLSAADDAVSRLDERLSVCAFAEGFRRRRDFVEAEAWSWTQGAGASAEDLLLHDQDMDVRTPHQGLGASYGVVLARRKIAVGGAELVSTAGVEWLLGRRRKPPAAGPGIAQLAGPSDPDAPSVLTAIERALSALERGESSDLQEGVGEWLEIAAGLDARAPALLRAAVMIEAWWIIDPAPSSRYVGGLLVERWLAGVGRIRGPGLGFETGLRLIGRGRSAEIRSGDSLRRVGFWLGVLRRSAEDALVELQRLELARQIMLKQVAGRRAHARAFDVMRLLLEHPVVTAPFLAEQLGMSQHGARRSLEELGSVVKEVSGRRRFRAWRV